MYDLIVKNATIVDGTGADPFEGDVGARGDSIETVGDLGGAQAARVIDAAGLTLTPGFIDIHSHGDFSVPGHPDMESCTCQGITTIFAGHCGMSAMPIDRYYAHSFCEGAAFARVIPSPTGGHYPGRPQIVDTAILRPAYREVFGCDLDWTGFGSYMEHLERSGIGANMAGVVGHGQIRLQVMGPDYKRPATKSEVERMKEYVRQAMAEGAWGISLGLDYFPGVFAEDEELREIALCVRELGGMITAHCQRRNLRRGITKKQYYIDGMKEMLELSRQTGVRMHISHIHKGYDVAPADDFLLEQAAKRTLEVLEGYTAKGVPVTWDVLGTHCGGLFHFPNLAIKMMPYIDDCGGISAFQKMLGVGSYKADLSAVIRQGKHVSVSPFSNLDPVGSPDWDTEVFITKSEDASLVGKTIRQISLERGTPYVDTVLDLLQADPYICYTSLRPESTPDQDVFTARPEAAIGLDGGVFPLAYAPSKADYPAEYAAPYTYCGMVMFLEQERDRGTKLEATIAKMTGNAAKILGMKDRGFVREGMAADLVLLDPENLKSNECLVDSRVAPDGIEYVIVNGKVEMEHKQLNHVRSGKAIRRTM